MAPRTGSYKLRTAARMRSWSALALLPVSAADPPRSVPGESRRPVGSGGGWTAVSGVIAQASYMVAPVPARRAAGEGKMKSSYA